MRFFLHVVVFGCDGDYISDDVDEVDEPAEQYFSVDCHADVVVLSQIVEYDHKSDYA